MDSVADHAIVWIDPQWGKSGWEFYQDCLAFGLGRRTIFESLGHTDAVIQFDELMPSTAATLIQREKENKRTVEVFLDALGRQREFAGLSEHALIKQWAQNESFLLLHQNPRKHLASGIWSFRPHSPSWKELCDECEFEDIAHRFRHLPVHPATLERMVAPAQRFFEPVFDSPAVKVRDGMGKGYDFDDALDQRKILIFEGGDLSEDEAGFLLRRIVLRVLEYKRRYGKTPVILVIDEAEAYRMIGHMEAKALKALGFYGLHMIIVCQTPWFFDEEVTRDVFQNADSHKWFRCPNYEIAALAAKDLQGKIDPWKVHHVDMRQRQRVADFEAVSTTSSTFQPERKSTSARSSSGESVISMTRQDSSTSHTTGMTYRPVYEEFVEETKHYVSLSDQERQIAIDVMNFTVGEFDWKLNGKIQHIVAPKPEDLWVWEGLGELRAIAHLQESKKHPPFTQITENIESQKCPQTTTGETENDDASNGSKRTHRRSRKSKSLDNSQVIKRRSGTSRNGRKGGSSNT